MATKSQQKRKELREKRLQAEQSAQSADKRNNLFKILGIAAFLVVVGVVIAIVALSSGSGGGGSSDNGQAQLAGLAQKGIQLGDPKAPVTLVEFGDLQCPICRQYAEEVLPDVITGPVKDGTANMEFENWAILGPDSVVAAKGALAAAEQNKMWNFLEAFYANQGVENSGYVTDDFMNEIAKDAGIPDIDKWNEDRNNPDFTGELNKIDATASNEGFTGTPSFAFREADGSLTPLDNTQSSQAIIDAINKAAESAKPGGTPGANQ